MLTIAGGIILAILFLVFLEPIIKLVGSLFVISIVGIAIVISLYFAINNFEIAVVLTLYSSTAGMFKLPIVSP